MPTAPTLDELINAANWMYYQSPNQLPADLVPLTVNGTPVQEQINADGFSAAAFETPSGQVIVAFEGTNTDPSSPAYNATLSANMVAADEQIAMGTNPDSIRAMTDATAFVATVAADTGVPATGLYVTGHSLGAGIASYVAFKDGSPGTVFAPPGLAFSKSTSTFPSDSLVNYVDFGDPVGNFASNPPNPLGLAPTFLGATHIGTTDYVGTPAARSLLIATGYILDNGLVGGDAQTVALQMLGGEATVYHPLTGYAANLGLPLTNPSAGGGSVTSGGSADATALASAQAGSSAASQTPFSIADVNAISGVVLGLVSTPGAINVSIYSTAGANSGFAASVSGEPNLAFLDPAAGNASGSYTVPGGYQAMIATGTYSYRIAHPSGGTATRIVANAGQDTVVSAVSGDTVQAGTGYLYDVQQSGALSFVGGSNASTVFGGVGTTTYYGGAGNDLVVGGTGGGSLLAGGSGSETLVGGGAGSVFGGSGSNVLFGGTGDLLVAGAGNTTLLGGQNDRVYLGGGAGTVFGAAGDTIAGGSGTAVAVLGGGSQTFVGGAGSDVVFGGAGALDMVLGGGGAAVVAGSGTATFNAVSGTTSGNTVIFGFSNVNDQLAFSGYGAGQVTQSVVNGSLVVQAQGAAITLVGVTSPVASA